jgi:hypothetical protein
LSNLLFTHIIKKNMKKDVTNLMRFLSLTIMLALVVPVMAHAQAGKANFAGTWAMNAEKSTQPPAGQGGGGGGMRMGGGNFVATQDANLLTVARTRTGQDGQATTTTMKYTLDGKESVNASQRGDSKSVASWSADGKTLTIVTTRTMDRGGESMTMKTTEVWTLTSDAVLSITTTRPGQDGEVKTITVYDKK